MVQGQVFLKRVGGGWHFTGFPIVVVLGGHTPPIKTNTPHGAPPQLKMKPHPSEKQKQTPPPPPPLKCEALFH